MGEDLSRGRVKWFSDIKGYGFVNSEADPNMDIFVHYSVIQNSGFKSLREGQEVQFELVEGPKGLYADNVELIQV